MITWRTINNKSHLKGFENGTQAIAKGTKYNRDLRMGYFDFVQ